MTRRLTIALVTLVFAAATTAAYAQEQRHIEIRIINPSRTVEKAETPDTTKEVPKQTMRAERTPPAQTDDISQVIRKSMPAVVTITTEEGLGSGFFISNDGYLLTNSHVIRDGGWPSVQLSDGKRLSANIVRNDEEKDLALLKVSGSGYAFLPLGDSGKAVQGESVIAIGSPVGLEGTVTRGIVSALRKAPNGVTYLQTDAAVNPGNSGGPLLNRTGEVIGINTMVIKRIQADTDRLGFAISINDAKKFVGR